MPRKCSVCVHGEVKAIDAALVEGQPFRSIAAQYDVSTTALQRHKRSHIPKSLSKATKAQEVAKADELLGQVSTLQARALNILEEAESGGDLRTALFAIREARSCIELLAKLVGELRSGTQINVVANPMWINVRGKILSSLAPFPEARTAVSEALTEIGDAS